MVELQGLVLYLCVSGVIVAFAHSAAIDVANDGKFKDTPHPMEAPRLDSVEATQSEVNESSTSSDSSNNNNSSSSTHISSGSNSSSTHNDMNKAERNQEGLSNGIVSNKADERGGSQASTDEKGISITNISSNNDDKSTTASSDNDSNNRNLAVNTPDSPTYNEIEENYGDDTMQYKVVDSLTIKQLQEREPVEPVEADDQTYTEDMDLPDDVIIDALFTNIDTLQDELEMCEEGLRRELSNSKPGQKTKTHHDIFDDDIDYQDDDDNDDDDDNKDDEDSEEVKKKSASRSPPKSPKTKIPLANAHPQDHERHANLSESSPTQRVKNRLSARLEYLKKSLVECYILYKELQQN